MTTTVVALSDNISSKRHRGVYHMTPAGFFQKKIQLFLKSVLLFSSENCFPGSSKTHKVQNIMF